jgi:hypothetical protein
MNGAAKIPRETRNLNILDFFPLYCIPERPSLPDVINVLRSVRSKVPSSTRQPTKQRI